jgi:hypothetical protein
MSGEARNHHFLPQAYLKGFTRGGSKKSKLWVLDMEERRQFRTIPRNVGSQRDFNRLEVDGQDPNVVERSLSGFEGDVARVIEWVDRNEKLPDGTDFAVLVNFIALLGVRNPKIRQTMEDFQAETYRRIAELSVFSREIWESQIERMRADGYQGPEVPYEEIRDFVREGRYEVQIPVGYHVGMELSMIDAVLPYLFGRKWILMVAKINAGYFVCSDRPVAIMPTVPGMAGQPLGFGITRTDVTIPLNRRLALSGRFEGSSSVLPVDTPMVAAVNAHTIAYGERFVYSPSRSFDHLTHHGIRTENTLLIPRTG